MTVVRQSIRAVDGFPLAVTVYEPWTPNAERRLVIINGATGVRQEYYSRFARFLAEEGFHVVTYDYRGIGQSLQGRLRRVQGGAREWASLDAIGVLRWARARFPEHSVTLVGHSLGGQILGWIAPELRPEDSLVNVAAQSGYWKHFRAPEKFALFALWHFVMPTATRALGYFPSKWVGFGENLPSGVALEWASWCRQPEYLMARNEQIREATRSLSHAVLWYSFEDDSIAPPRAVEALIREFCSARVFRRHLKPGDQGRRGFGHFGFFRERIGKPYWREIADWARGKRSVLGVERGWHEPVAAPLAGDVRAIEILG